MSSVHTIYSSHRYRVTTYTAHCNSFFTLLSDPIYMSRLRTNRTQNRYFQSPDACLETFADQGFRGGKPIIKRPHTVLWHSNMKSIKFDTSKRRFRNITGRQMLTFDWFIPDPGSEPITIKSKTRAFSSHAYIQVLLISTLRLELLTTVLILLFFSWCWWLDCLSIDLYLLCRWVKYCEK